MGDFRIAGRGRYSQRFGSARRCLPSAHTEKRWILGRAILYRHWIPARVLSDVPPLSRLLSAARADDLRKSDGEGGALVLSSRHPVVSRGEALRGFSM